MLCAFDLELIQFLSTLCEENFVLRSHYLTEFCDRHNLRAIKDLERFVLSPEIEALSKQAHKYALGVHKFQIISNSFIFKGDVTAHRSGTVIKDLASQFKKCNASALLALFHGKAFSDLKQIILKKLILKELQHAFTTLKSSIESGLDQKPPKYTTRDDITSEIDKLLQHIPRTFVECLRLQSIMVDKIRFLDLHQTIQIPEIVIPEYIPEPGTLSTPRKAPAASEGIEIEVEKSPEEIETEKCIGLLRGKIKSLEKMMDSIVKSYPEDNVEIIFLACFLESTLSLLSSLYEANLSFSQLTCLDLILGKTPLVPLPKSGHRKQNIKLAETDAIDPADNADSDSDNWDDIGEIPTDRGSLPRPLSTTGTDDDDWDTLEREFGNLTLTQPPPITPSFSHAAAAAVATTPTVSASGEAASLTTGPAATCTQEISRNSMV